MSYKREKFGHHTRKDTCDFGECGQVCPKCGDEVCACRTLIERLEGFMCAECSDTLDQKLYDEAPKVGGGGCSLEMYA